MERHLFIPTGSPLLCHKCGRDASNPIHLSYTEISEMGRTLKTKEQKMEILLEKCEEYFDRIADADQPSGAISTIPNEEMVLLAEIRRVLGRG